MGTQPLWAPLNTAAHARSPAAIVRRAAALEGGCLAAVCKAGGDLEWAMRIAFYAPLKSPTHEVPSGDRRVARLLMDALQVAGHAVQLASSFRSFDGAGDAAHQAALRDEGASIADGLVQRWLGLPPADRPELWFTYHLYYKAPDWLGPAVSHALGIPYVVSEASYAPKRANGAWAIGHLATYHAIRAAALLLCPTGDDVACLQLVAPAHTRVLRLFPFLDPAAYQIAALDRAVHRARLSAIHGIKASDTWIVVAAMMRYGDKLASYELLAKSLPFLVDLPWQLVVAGDGPARAQVEALIQGAAPGRAHFLGVCDAQALAAIYAASDLCLWPAVNEAYGMAMLEAQAAGVPVVSCAARGVPDVVCDGRTGLLAKTGDAPGLARLTRELVVGRQRRVAMGQAAAQFVRQERSTVHAAAALNLAFAGLSCGGAQTARGVGLK